MRFDIVARKKRYSANCWNRWNNNSEVFDGKLGIELNLSASLRYVMAMSGLFRPSNILPSVDKTQKPFV